MFTSTQATDYAGLIESIAYNQDNIAFYERRLRDMRDDRSSWAGLERINCERQINRFRSYIADTRAQLHRLVRI
jgi:hypothetical protein